MSNLHIFTTFVSKNKEFMYKKLLTITAGLLLSVTAVQADEVLIIQPADDTPQKIELKNIRHLSFIGNQIVVTSRTGTALYFMLEDVEKLSFGEKAQVGINTPMADNINLSVYITPQGELKIISEVQVLSLVVYDINGRKLLTSNTDKLNVSALSTGAYLLNIETTQGFLTKKFIKQ